MSENIRKNLDNFLKQTINGIRNVRHVIEFKSCVQIHEKIRYMEWLMNNYKFFDKIEMEFKANSKNNELSIEYRDESEKFLKNGLHDLAIYEINKSICYASTTVTNNLSKAYIHRASINDFNDCEEIDVAMQNIQLAKKSLNEESSEILDEIDKKDKYYMLKAFAFSIAKTRNGINGIDYDGITESVGRQRLRLASKLSYPLHEKFPFIGNCLNVQKINDGEKYVFCTKIPLQPGDCIAVEKSFVNILKPDDVYLNCLNCSKSDKMSGLIPCENCSSAMFCSDECKNEAYLKFHKYECKISNLLDNDIMDRDKIILSLRIILILLDLFDNNMENFEKFINDQEKYNCTIFDDTNTNCTCTKDYLKNMSNEKLIKLKQYQTFFVCLKKFNCGLDLQDLVMLTGHISILKKALMCTPLKDVIVSQQHMNLFGKLLYKHILCFSRLPREYEKSFCTLKMFCETSFNPNSVLTYQENEWILTVKNPIPSGTCISVASIHCVIDGLFCFSVRSDLIFSFLRQ